MRDTFRFIYYTRIIMIIERKYVPFGLLCERDPKSKEVFMNAFNKSYSEGDRDRIWSMLYYQCLYERDMGWCFTNLIDVINGFDLLDDTDPYDNGFSLDDVNDADVVANEEDYLIINLLYKAYGESFIVKRLVINK